MKFNRLPIVSAAFLIVAMTIQFVMSYHREKVELEERIQYKMELAQKDFFFEDMLNRCEKEEGEKYVNVVEK